MVRIIKQSEVVVGNRGTYYEYAGLNGDTKPVSDDIVTGSLFMEVDTGDVYAYNEEAASGSEWGKICSLGGDT